MQEENKFSLGDYVHYTPFFGFKENGRISSIKGSYAYVVYKCAGKWNSFRNYTAVMTPLVQLKTGWINADEPINKEKIKQL